MFNIILHSFCLIDYIQYSSDVLLVMDFKTIDLWYKCIYDIFDL